MTFSNKFKQKFNTITDLNIKYLTILEAIQTLEDHKSSEAKELLDIMERDYGVYIDIKKDGNTRNR
jgi:hypothetical protein